MEAVSEYVEHDPSFVEAMLGSQHVRAYCAFDVLGQDENHVDLDIACVAGAGDGPRTITAALVNVVHSSNRYDVTSSRLPRDGSLNATDVVDMFGTKVANEYFGRNAGQALVVRARDRARSLGQ